MLASLLNFIRPPDNSDPKTLKRWRWNVALLLLMLSVFAAWTFTPDGYARAQTVDEKVKAAVEPIQKQVADVDKKVSIIATDLTETKTLLIRKLTQELEREIVDTKLRQCKASTVEAAAYFRNQLIEKQADYRELTKGPDFVAPSCAET